MRIVDFLDRGAYEYPNRDFCIDATGCVSYLEMQYWSKAIGAQLLALGVQQGTKVGCLSSNCNAVFAYVYGLNRVGAVWVPLNGLNSRQDNLTIIQDFDVDCVLYHPKYAEMIDVLQSSPENRVRHFIKMELRPEAVMRHQDGAIQDMSRLAFNPGRLTSLFPTGGTTGRPKGVMLTELTWATKAANIAVALPVTSPPRHLVVAPLTHGAGSFAMSLTAQGATHFVHDGFKAEDVLAAISAYGVTHLFLPPTALYALLAHPDLPNHDYSSLKYFIYGAAPSSPQKIKEAMAVFGLVMTHGYGLTEAPGSMTFLLPSEHRAGARMRSCGRASILVELRIVSEKGDVKPHGDIGEIEVRGPLVMAGYYKNPDATTDAMHGDWLRTGDIGYMDAEGYLYIVDRSKELIITGGFNVYPAEVEQVILGFSGIQDCAVIGIPDAKWGEAVTLIVQPKPGHHVNTEELLVFCRDQLGSVKTPKSVHIKDNLPRSSVGKVLKRKLRDEFWQNTDRKI